MGYYPYDNQLSDCAQCGRTLTGRQERYCSGSCRQAAHRATNQAWTLPTATCPLCGELFQVTTRRKKFCDYAEEAEDDCRAAQDDAEEATWLAAEARRDARCAHCAEPAGWTGRGRPRRFCSPRCKQADYRKRRAQQAA